MVLRLAEAQQISMSQRNALLLAAGYAPLYESRKLCVLERLPHRPSQECGRFLILRVALATSRAAVPRSDRLIWRTAPKWYAR